MSARATAFAPDWFTGSARAAPVAGASTDSCLLARPVDRLTLPSMADGDERIDELARAVPATMRHSIPVTGLTRTPADTQIISPVADLAASTHANAVLVTTPDRDVSRRVGGGRISCVDWPFHQRRDLGPGTVLA